MLVKAISPSLKKMYVCLFTHVSQIIILRPDRGVLIVGDVFVVHGFDGMTLIAMWDMFTGESECDNSTIFG